MAKAHRRTVAVVWGIVTVVLFSATAFGGGFLGVYLGSRSPGGTARWAPLPGLILGLFAGMAATVGLLYGARVGLLRLRLRRLRSSGRSARATVSRVDGQHIHNPRGGSSMLYTVSVQWGHHQGERHYRFRGNGSDRFTDTCHHGATVTVWYPESDPERFVIDIPFTPVMEDIVG